MQSSLSQQFAARGFCGPIPIFSEAECQRILQRLSRKSHNPTDGFFTEKNAIGNDDLEIARNDAILSRVTSILGSDVLFWGAALIDRKPGQFHPWHSDIETADDSIRSVSVWIGLEGITAKSSLQLISYSHRFGCTLQEVRSLNSIPRTNATSERALQLAQERNPESRIHTPCQKNGEAIFFDGRIWHGSHNLEAETLRTALLLQFASTDSVIRVPDTKVLDWPFRYIEDAQPTLYLINGTDSCLRNNLMKLPARPGNPGMPAHETEIHPISLPLPENKETGWNPVGIHRGPSSQLNDLCYHVSTLSPGHTPHCPHRHREDEILLVLDGEIEIQLVDDESHQWTKMEQGTFSYYPAGQLHTLHNTSNKPVHYLMFKWYSDTPCETSEHLETAIVKDRVSTVPESDFHTEVVLEGPTASLYKFHAHYSTLKPGAGYAPHADAYDVAIVTLKGTIETLGKQVGPNSVIFYAAGDLHGIKNVGDESAEYLVLEFHGVPSSSNNPLAGQPISQRSELKLSLNRRVMKPIEQLAKRLVGVSPKA